MASSSEQIAARLNANREAFKAFLVARLGSPEDADDLLQDGLVKALRHGKDLKDLDRAPAWFYRLLRNSIIDHHRSRTATARRHEKLGTLIHSLGEDVADAPRGWEARICACLGGVVETMNSPQAELLRRVDLEDEPVAAVARDLGLTPNHASVTLHRARKELRNRLEKFCGACASEACLDCHCEPESR